MPNDSVSGPFVSVACICQVPLREANGQLSIIRVMDRIQVFGVTPAMQPQSLQHLVLVVVLRSGTLGENQKIRIVPVRPDGTSLPETEVSVLFEGNDRGPALIMPVALVATEAGLYWFDVYWETQLLTRIPLRVQYQRMQTPQFPQPPPQPPRL